MRLSPLLAFLLRLLPQLLRLFSLISSLPLPRLHASGPLFYLCARTLQPAPSQISRPLCLPKQLLRPLPLLSPPPPSACGSPGLQESPGKMQQTGSRKRRGGTWESPGSRLSSDGRRCQLRSSRWAPGGARLAELGAELRGVGCYFVIFPPKEWSVGKEWGETQRPRQFRNSSVGCGVSVPLTIVTCLPEGEPQRAGPGRQIGGERKIARAGGWGGGTCGGHTETVRARESEQARDFESITIVRPSGYLCAATLASTTPTFRTQDLTESISAPSDFSFRAGPLPKVS